MKLKNKLTKIMKHRIKILIIFSVMFGLYANATTDSIPTNTEHKKSKYFTRKEPIIHKKLIEGPSEDESQLVRVGKDTVSMVIPQKNYGRYDRGLFNYLYMPKGKWVFEITASYASLNTEDVQVLQLLKDLDFGGKIYSIKPSASYVFANNQSIGLRVAFTRGNADLGNLSVDIDDDMRFNLHDISYYSQSYNIGVFYRYYVGLNKSKRFAVFNETALQFNSGSSRFKRYYNDVLYDTYTSTRGASLNFSPGVCIFVHKYAAFNVSFGVFGVHFTKESQSTNGVDEGSRFSSGANFKFNLLNINFGILVVI